MKKQHEYLTGWKNLFIRWYFYLLTGVNAVGDFRNIGLAIFGLYITLKLTDPTLMALMFFLSVVILTPVGYFMIHKVSRVKEWLSTKYGSHYAIKNFDYVKAQYELLKEINNKLNDIDLRIHSKTSRGGNKNPRKTPRRKKIKGVITGF